MLSLKHHGWHRLSDSKLKVLTVIHNFYVRRKDGSTPAHRFFGKPHDDLFEHLLNKVPMLGRPKTHGEVTV